MTSMNKLVLPGILTAIVMVAGIFAFVPIEQASTVHTGTTGVNTSLEGLVDATDQNANNLDNAAEIIATAANAGIACVTITVTDDAGGGGNDPAVDIIIGGITVASPNPTDGNSIVVDECAAIGAGGTVVFDQLGADSADGGNTISGEVVIIADNA